tara:strand:+ start:737 stop:967 length:231 start_codon:yes stop_codon:yes gene_type:complete
MTHPEIQNELNDNVKLIKKVKDLEKSVIQLTEQKEKLAKLLTSDLFFTKDYVKHDELPDLIRDFINDNQPNISLTY